MQQMRWSSSKIKQSKYRVGQGVLSDERSIVFYSEDFGHLYHQQPAAIFLPESLSQLQVMLQFANQHRLPVTIRGQGLSQGGQALALDQGMLISMQHFTQVSKPEGNAIWVDANATWSQLVHASISQNLIPYVTPYNSNLAIAGVLSVGGIGAASFRYGSATAHVQRLEVVLANGEARIIDKHSDLFHACLGGQGRFAVINRAEIGLRSCLPQVRTFYLLYTDKDSWFRDIEIVKGFADFMETFCTPALQGAKLSDKGRLPFAQWFYALQFSLEFTDQVPNWEDLSKQIKPWQLLHVQDEDMLSYLHRHDSRFKAMQLSGQWSLCHPWFECFLTANNLKQLLPELLTSLPLYYATILQVVPLAPKKEGFLMLPQNANEDIFALMILNPGLSQPLVEGCKQAIEYLNQLVLPLGGKRYLSGYLGTDTSQEYWKKHFDGQYESWIGLKKKYDPNHIFCSLLHNE